MVERTSRRMRWDGLADKGLFEGYILDVMNDMQRAVRGMCFSSTGVVWGGLGKEGCAVGYWMRGKALSRLDGSGCTIIHCLSLTQEHQQ